MDRKEQMDFIDAEPWPFWATIITAGCLSALIGFLLGFPALRLSGPYLAIATLALVISFPSILRKYDGFTGGTQGIIVRQPGPPGFLGDTLDNDKWLYFLSLTIAALMLLVAWSILRGPLGRAFVAVRDSEVAAAAMGINVAETKVTAFTISAFFAGIAGGLFTQVYGVVTPDSIDIVTSINFLTAIVIGGLASILGAVIGAAAIVFLPEDGPALVGRLPLVDESVVKRAPGAIQGAIVIFVILIMPQGIAGFYHRLTRTTPAAVLRGIADAPSALGQRALDIRESLAESWDSLRWRRREPGSPPESPEGG
jgi:branched-chain amino acid transport system permease protein